MNTEDELKTFLRECAEERWKEEQPYMLSMVAPTLKLKQMDYKTILGDERLKSFIKRTEKEGGYRLVEHPNQTSKIGIVPAFASFAFDAGAKPAGHREQPSRHDQDTIVLRFLLALAELPEDDVNSVILPTRVLIKLLGKR